MNNFCIFNITIGLLSLTAEQKQRTHFKIRLFFFLSVLNRHRRRPMVPRSDTKYNEFIIFLRFFRPSTITVELEFILHINLAFKIHNNMNMERTF